MRDLILDTETTGLYPRDHRIIELACLDADTGECWQWYFNPQRSIDPGAERIHGISEDFLRDKPLFSDRADEIRGTIDGAHLIIHNAAFDVGFLNAEFARLDGFAPIDPARVTCTLALARRKHPGQKNNLDALCARYGVDNSRRGKHSALHDCELLAEVWRRMTGPEQAVLELSVGAGVEASVALVRPKPLPSRLSAEEEIAHAVFVASLGAKAVWLKLERNVHA